MSTALRIAAVGEALQALLLPVVQAVAADAQVRIGPPTAEVGGQLWTGLNLYLFHIARNTNQGALDLPTRNPRGTVEQRPMMAIDLHYVFSFYGDASRQVPEQLLGGVMSALNAEPTLTGVVLSSMVAHDPAGFVARSELVDQPERVSFEILKMTLEDLTRVWGMFQTPYTLTVPVMASLVMLEAELVPRPAPPVRLVHLSVGPGPAPELVGGEPAVVEEGDVVAIAASGLDRHGALVEIGGERFEADRVDANGLRLRLDRRHLEGVRAGPVAVRVMAGDGVHVGETGVVVRPRVRQVEALRVRQPGVLRPVGRAAPVAVQVEVTPPVGREQVVGLRLVPVRDPTRRIGGQPSASAPLSPETVEVDPAGAVVARFAAVAGGVYRVELSVDAQAAVAAPVVRNDLARDMVRVR